MERLTRDFFQCVFSDSSALLFFVGFFSQSIFAVMYLKHRTQ